MSKNKTRKSKQKTKQKAFHYPKEKKTRKLNNQCVGNYQPFESELEKSDIYKSESKMKNIERKLIQRFQTPFTPSKITPHDDFYTYINYRWLKDTARQSSNSPEKEKYFVQVDDFRIIQNKVYVEVIDLVKEFIKKSPSSPVAKNVSAVYQSLYNLNPKKIDLHIRHMEASYEFFMKQDNLWAYLAHWNQNEILNAWCPLVWRMDPDQKNATIYQNTINMPILSIYDYMTYIVDMNKENDRQHNYRLMLKRKFIKYVDEIFDSCLGKGKHGLHGKDVYDVEYQLLVAMGCQGIKENADYYNKVKADEALPKYGFDWPAFSRHLGYKQVPPFFICNNLNYLRCINKLLQDNWKTPQWKSFWYYTALKQMIRFDKKRRNIHFEYHEKLLHGQPSPFPQEIYPIFGLSFTFNTLLTKLYYDANYNQSKIHFVKSFYTDLLAVYKRIVKRNSWMSSKTKNYAIHKLNHLKLIVGKPDVLREDPLLDYDADDAWGNMRKLADWKLRKSLLLMNNPVVDIPYFDWNIFKLIGKQSYIVNAFYTPTENSIYIPLAILQDPFINFTGRGVEYNLSHIGITLSHEMSHSLDKWGSKYNAHGNLHNWWTKEDTRKYNLIIKDIIQQYEEFARYDGIEFDASIGIGEDMADISGLAIAEEYLRDYHMINNSVVPIVSLSFQKFFIFYAVQNRQHIYKQAFDAQLKTNPHPMDKYRTNVPLSRLELFRSLYNIKKGDKMWWHSTSTIW